MSATSGDQLELLSTTREPQRPQKAGLLGLVLDQNAFLQFLSDEWILPSGGRLLLGTQQACSARPGDAPQIAVWFDTRHLPDSTVMAWRDTGWSETTLRSVQLEDAVVSWSGPLPAFAVDHFSVDSDAVRAKLLAMARNFADMDVPEQPFYIGPVQQVAPPREAPPGISAWQPPHNWDALRGAAAMAAYAVPAIDPWIELLCELLRDGVSKPETAEMLHAPWWRAALWSDGAELDELPALWRAILAQLSDRSRLREWRAKAILDNVCEHARALGEDEDRLTRLLERSRALLEDRGTIEDLGLQDDFLALTFQLLLLRPSPERFASWREEWRAIPPVVWWTGMTLAGYLQGYRELPKQYRGSQESRRLLALKTWQHACSNGSGPWQAVTPDFVAWRADKEAYILTADARPWASYRLGTRGSWYRALFENLQVRREAEDLAVQECPEALEQIITLTDAKIQVGGGGTIKVTAKSKSLEVTGRVELALGQSGTIERRLNTDRFKDWMATASIKRGIHRPSQVREEDARIAALSRADELKPTKTAAKKKVVKRASPAAASLGVVAPPGLTVLPLFISDSEEAILIATIDAQEWDRSMKRRVQHYGWRYDYKARKVQQSNFLGPLPAWAEELAERLLKARVVPEMPDQVIVNDYLGTQGISKHIDCKDCFRGPVVTISLLETWDMVFTRKVAGESQRFVQTLPRCSAAVLDGEARSDWFHEIPERINENGKQRVRRVSITFRKVAN